MIELSKELMQELDGMVEEPKLGKKWTEERIEIVRYLYDKTTVEGILKILQKKFPEYNWTNASVRHAIRNYVEVL